MAQRRARFGWRCRGHEPPGSLNSGRAEAQCPERGSRPLASTTDGLPRWSLQNTLLLSRDIALWPILSGCLDRGARTAEPASRWFRCSSLSRWPLAAAHRAAAPPSRPSAARSQPTHKRPRRSQEGPRQTPGGLRPRRAPRRGSRPRRRRHAARYRPLIRSQPHFDPRLARHRTRRCAASWRSWTPSSARHTSAR